MIRPCTPQDFDQIHAIINDGAQAYKDVIPADRFPDPYMSHDHLNHEIASGVISRIFLVPSHRPRDCAPATDLSSKP